MFALLFLLFLLTPLIEIALFIQVGGWIGLWPTLAIVVITAVLGAALWRAEGLATIARAQAALNKGEIPVQEVAGGAFLIFAGALLLTPGFFTDTVGFLLLIPPVRYWLARVCFRAMRKNVKVHVVHPRGEPGGPSGGPGAGRGPVIDGEAEEIDR